MTREQEDALLIECVRAYEGLDDEWVDSGTVYSVHLSKLGRVKVSDPMPEDALSAPTVARRLSSLAKDGRLERKVGFGGGSWAYRRAR